MGSELLSSRSYINNLPFLLTFVSPSSPSQHVLESILSLQSFFTPVLSDLPPSSSSKHSTAEDSKEDPDFIYRTWLRSKFDEFVKSLIDVLVSSGPEETLKELVLDTVMEFVKNGKGRSFHSAIYYRLLQNIVHSTTPVVLLVDLLSSKYFKYIDVRYFTYISLEKLARTLDSRCISDDRIMETGEPTTSSGMRLELVLQKIHYIISNIPIVEDSEGILTFEMWSGSDIALDETDHKELPRDLLNDNNHAKTGKGGSNVLCATNISKKMKQKFTKAWISYLRLPLPLEVYKEVLVNLHQTVIPHMSNPIVLCDFLTRSYDVGGVVSVMALSSLYVLMTQYGLEYPNFYGKLYALLVPSVFMAKHRAKFFQLLDSCLNSPLLPAYLAASFAKRLSRLSLSVPPSGSLVVTALIHNLLRRHPSINFLVHMEDDDDKPRNDNPEIKNISAEDNATSRLKMSRSKRCVDQFNNEEANPLKSNAMRSSLWEMDTLRHHYCPPVSRFVLSLENDLTVRAKTTEIAVKDFGSSSYSTIFGEEIRRRVKQVPLAFYRGTPTALFSDSDFAGWAFKCVGDTMNDERTDIDTDNSPIDDITSTKRRRTESV